MANNRLYLYDPETNTAILLAKGFSNGWAPTLDLEQLGRFLDQRDIACAAGFRSRETSLQLRTEYNLPDDCDYIPSNQDWARTPGS